MSKIMRQRRAMVRQWTDELLYTPSLQRAEELCSKIVSQPHIEKFLSPVERAAILQRISAMKKEHAEIRADTAVENEFRQ